MSNAHTSRSLLLIVSLLVLVGCGGELDRIAEPIRPHDVATSAVGQPTSITVTCSTVTGCWVNWTGNETWDDAIIYRSSTDDFSAATQVSRKWASSFFRDDNVQAGTQYYYWVVFVDRDGQRSLVSASASACVGSCTSSPGPRAEDRVPPSETEDWPSVPPELTPIPDALQSPVSEDFGHLFVGIRDGFISLDNLEVFGVLNDIIIGYTTTRDGVDRGTLENFLWDSARYENARTGMPIVMRLEEPATVTFDGSDLQQEDIDLLTRAVQIVNAALPYEWRLQMSADDPIPESGIHVEFWSERNYQARASYESGELGMAKTYLDGGVIEYSEITINRAYLDSGDGRAVEVLVHELVHAIGLGHVGDGWDSLMRQYGNFDDSFPPMTTLHLIDRAALRAIYHRMEPGDTFTDFGEWDDLTSHILGRGDHVDFGVAWANGYGEPWARGIAPHTDLANNPYLSGSASWEGLLLGAMLEKELGGTIVTGDALLLIHLGSLVGSAHFTNLESWAVEGGEMWGDGDLGYLITVDGNTFMQTGGDEGYLTGAFFGRRHESMGGTLEREDLSAAFGGTR